MKVGYVVLYVENEKDSLEFWTRQIGLVVKASKTAGSFTIHEVGFPHQDFAFELVPLKLMAENPDGLNLGTPSICFRTDDLAELRQQLVKKGVTVTEVSEHFGITSFAFSDPAGHWFAVTQ